MKQSNEKYTPLIYLASARKVFGGIIDLDPASSISANQRVKANKIFTGGKLDNAFYHDWFGNVWLNPPYSKSKNGSLLAWINKISRQWEKQTFKQAILLTPNWTERKWFRKLWNFPICFTDHRIEFIDGIEYTKSGRSILLTNPEGGSCFTYFGSHHREFLIEFSKYGHIVGANSRSQHENRDRIPFSDRLRQEQLEKFVLAENED